jgi:tetratricopeptide (TPR) repeat protein
MNPQVKTIKEHIARAKSFVNRFDLTRTLGALADAVKEMQTAQVYGREKFEIEILINEALHNLNSIEEMRAMVPSGFQYKRGQEKRLYLILSKLHKAMKDQEQRQAIEKERAIMNEVDAGFAAGQRMIDENRANDARKVLRTVTTKFPDVHGVHFDAGDRLLKAGYPQESLDFFRTAIEQDFRDARPYGGLSAALEEMNEIEQALNAILEAHRIFGNNESILLRIARLQLKLRNWGEAYNSAKAVLDHNPGSRDAKRILEKVEPKIFTKSGS